MIITRIFPHAGMGNQMFMYAAGLATAHRLNTELRLMVYGLRHRTTLGRQYYLDSFPAITERFASFAETWKISPSLAVLDVFLNEPVKRHQIFKRLIRKICTRLHDKSVYHATYGSYSPEFESIPDDTCIIGFWESEKIFSGIESLVREKFKFAPEYYSSELCRKVRGCNSAAIHVRRGDKVKNKDFYCSDEGYIRHAIEMISSMTETPHLFVFSDNIAWCKEHRPQIYGVGGGYTFIEGQTPPQDMALMTQCKHVITGPSTFSWWGAWLNDNPNKIVIAPDVNLWYKPGTYNPENRKYLLPESWIKLG